LVEIDISAFEGNNVGTHSVPYLHGGNTIREMYVLLRKYLF
jgi:hypothetical protein